jgi:hypothetical protein
MTQEYSITAIVVLCLAVLWFLSPTFRRVVVGAPDLKIEELPAIFHGQQSFYIERDPAKKMLGADKSTQAYNEKVSIIYHTTGHTRGLTETLDICYPGKFGMIFTVVNGRVTCFERIGGRTRNNPELSPSEQEAIDQFMIGVRKCFSNT